MYKKNNNKRNYRNKKGAPRSKATEPATMTKEKEVAKGVENDASWYGDDVIINNVANIPFTNANGFPVAISGSQSKAATVRTPGICVLKMAPAIGYSMTNTSPINVASRNLYSYIIKGKSGAAPFDHSDMMMYLLAMDSIYAAYAWCARTYGLIRFFNQQDKYFPRAIVEASGFDYDDFLINISNYRYYLNYICNTVNKFYVPGVLDYMKRHFWLYSNVYMDEPVAHCQYYMYAPHGFYQLQISASDGYYLQYKDLNMGWGTFGKGLKFQGFVNNMQAMIDVINTNQDFSYISGYFLNAFGDGKAFSLTPIPEDLVTVPQYSAEVLEQMHNTEVSTMTAAEDSPTGKTFAKGLDIVTMNDVDDPNAGALLAAPKLQANNLNTTFTSVLNFSHSDVKPGDVIVATRNCYVASGTWNNGDSKYDILISSCGSDICMGAYFTYGFLNSSGSLEFKTEDGDTVVTTNDGIGMLSAFHYSPRIMLTSGTKPNEKYSYFGELANFTQLSEPQLTRMHDVAMQGLFDVPFVGIMA